MEIVSDLQSMNEEENEKKLEEVQQPVRIFLNKNNEFLEKEISFFITNLRNVISKINNI
jgi:hypothetical protein